MKILGFDIETIPCRTMPEECIPKFDPDTVKYGNTKDPAKKQEKEREARQEFDNGLVKTMSVDPDLCEVCTFVGMIYDTEEEKILQKTSVQETGEDENDYDPIYDGWDMIKHAYQERIPLVSYNGIGFDLPVMLHRAMYLDIPVPYSIYSNLTKKWEGNKNHYDLMLVMAGWDRYRYKKLDFYLKRLGIGAKTEGMDGSKVYDTWKCGEFSKIQRYCEDDVLETCKMFARIEPWIV